MIPGRSVVNRVTITNAGTTGARTIALVPAGSCVQVSASTVTDLCSRIRVSITSGATTVFTGTAEELGRASVGQLRMPRAPGSNQHVAFTFTATLSPQAGNDYMGLEARVPVRWTLAA